MDTTAGDDPQRLLDRARSAVGGAIHRAVDRIRSIDHREVAMNLGVVLVTVLLFLGAVEGALRVGVIDTPEERTPSAYEWCEGPDNRSRFHPEYGWVEHPGHVYLERTVGASGWDFHAYNQEGFRDLYDTGNRSVVVLGDSHTRGSLVDNNATYPHLLDRWTPDVAFRNYGTGGYSTGQSLIVYRNVSQRIDHELVVLGYYLGNDAADNVDTSEPKRPRFALEDGELRQVHTPSRTGNTSSGGGGGGLLGHPLVDDVQDVLRDNTETYRWLEPRLHAILGRAGLVDYGPPTGDELARQIALTGALLEALADEAASRDARFLIVTIPERGEVNPKRPVRYELEVGRSYWDAQRRMIQGIADRRSNVSWLDPTATLRDHVEDGQRMYGQGNAHLDEPGHRVLARSIHGWMADHDLVSAPEAIDFERDYTRPGSAECP